MLSTDLFTDSELYLWFDSLYAADNQSFGDHLDRYQHFFAWYPLTVAELSGLPSGFALDLRPGTHAQPPSAPLNEVLSVRLQHVNGEPHFTWGDRLLDGQPLALQGWEVRIGLLQQAAA
jgi:hypothetical protein